MISPHNSLLEQVRNCQLCVNQLPHKPRPVMNLHPKSKVVIIGQAPGKKVHQSGIPWDDPSGNTLRKWLGVSKEAFYSVENFAILPMGFCYPGKGSSGDLPPRPECAAQWHAPLLGLLKQPGLTLLIGHYAQNYYLASDAGATLTQTVQNWRNYIPRILPLPHPSPRNRFWLQKNPWFEQEVLPYLQHQVAIVLESAPKSLA